MAKPNRDRLATDVESQGLDYGPGELDGHPADRLAHELVKQFAEQGAVWEGGRLRIPSDKVYLLSLNTGDAAVFGAGSPLLRAVGGHRIYELNLVSRVGRLRLGSLQLEVVSSKMDEQVFHCLVDEVSHYVTSLPFSYEGVGAGYSLSRPSAVPTKFHTFVHVRHLLQQNALQSAVARIVSDPHAVFLKERADTRVERARRIDGTTVRLVAARPRHFEKAGSNVQLSVSPLGARLAPTPLAGHFPGRVSAPRMISVIDNGENQFVLHALEWMLREVSSLTTSDRCPADVASEGRHVIRDLERLLAHDLFRHVSSPERLAMSSQVLQRKAGYREMLRFYSQLALPPVPRWADDVEQIVELKNAALLYEYWVFVTVCKLVDQISGSPVEAYAGGIPASEVRTTATRALRVERRTDLEVTLATGLSVRFPGAVHVDYNPHIRGYSGSFYPDVTITTPAGMWVFDAKFRLQSAGEQGDSARRARADDIHKMHAYRDALPNCRGAYVVYPGDEGTMWPDPGVAESSELDGVGAIPLRPGGRRDVVRRVLNGIVGKGSSQSR